MQQQRNRNAPLLEENTLIRRPKRFTRWAKMWYSSYLPVATITVWFLAVTIPDNNKFGSLVTNLAPEMLGMLITLFFIEVLSDLDNERDDKANAKAIKTLRSKVKEMDAYLKRTLASIQDESQSQNDLLNDLTIELKALREDLAAIAIKE